MSIKYTVNFDLANQHIYQVTIQIPAHKQKQLNLSLPAWIPGSYMIRDFAKNIIDLRASANGQEIEVELIDKQSWKISTLGQACEISYQVYAYDSSVRTAYLDQQRAFFNGTSLFISVDEFADAPQQVELQKPSFTDKWKVATGLQRPNDTIVYQFGLYQADNYAELIDCPVEIGDFTHLEFEVAGTPHYLILNGKHFADCQRLIKDVSKLCQHHIDLFERETGGKPPFNEYWFLTNILPSGFGGLEHKNSTALLCSTFDFPNINKPGELSEGYKTFLSLASHEYFHNWNVCRIKPQEFIPYQLNSESYTKQLWAFEGITSYYDDLSLYRTNIVEFSDYLKTKSKTISRVNRGKGQLKQNLIESSFYTWTKFYQQGPDAANNIVSYYTKGSLVALWLDLNIRKHTGSAKSLDDVMRALWQEYLDGGEGYSGTQLETVIDIAESITQAPIKQAFFDILNGKDIVPLTELLAEFGVEYKQAASKINSPLDISAENHSPYLGIIYKEAKLGLEIAQVLNDSPAEQAGLSVQDVIVALDNLVVNTGNFSNIANNLNLDKSYPITYVRNGELFTTQVQLVKQMNELVELKLVDEEKAKGWQQIN
ncbi:peptidase M61 domain-containing protein [Catenovulum agarivorans DS-2]|uniref:Peptidase M61 domain-containing protein n=1 Tax=Catenovulum agarivorans DS-2 TaxID=1328313 RepID=W7R148_9ALTE|nr:PDZ domain-containing protein [Catenovulum agarivorans]EWH11325.1 peptidase M61 domain-containing protein [Catenovulum agarivorans DS-2]